MASWVSKEGLLVYDHIISVDDSRVFMIGDLKAAIKKAGSDKEVPVLVSRNWAQKILNIKIVHND